MAVKLATSVIKKAVIVEFGLDATEFISADKHRTNARARQLAMWFCRQQHRTFAEIGLNFGHRDHSTVRHGCGVIEKLIAEDPDWRERVDRIGAKLGVTVPL